MTGYSGTLYCVYVYYFSFIIGAGAGAGTSFITTAGFSVVFFFSPCKHSKNDSSIDPSKLPGSSFFICVISTPLILGPISRTVSNDYALISPSSLLSDASWADASSPLDDSPDDSSDASSDETNDPDDS